MVPLSGKCYPLILIAVLLLLLGFGGYRHIYRLQSIVIITIIIPSSCVLFLGTRVIVDELFWGRQKGPLSVLDESYDRVTV